MPPPSSSLSTSPAASELGFVFDTLRGTRIALDGFQRPEEPHFSVDGQIVYAYGEIKAEVCALGRRPQTCAYWNPWESSPVARVDIIPNGLVFNEQFTVGGTIYSPGVCREVGSGFVFNAQTRAGDRDSMRTFYRDRAGAVRDLGVPRAFVRRFEKELVAVQPPTRNGRQSAFVRAAENKDWFVSLTHRQKCVSVPGGVSWETPPRRWADGIVYYWAKLGGLHALTDDGRFALDLGQKLSVWSYVSADDALYYSVREDDALVLYRASYPVYEPPASDEPGATNEDCKEDVPVSDAGRDSSSASDALSDAPPPDDATPVDPEADAAIADAAPDARANVVARPSPGADDDGDDHERDAGNSNAVSRVKASASCTAGG